MQWSQRPNCKGPIIYQENKATFLTRWSFVMRWWREKSEHPLTLWPRWVCPDRIVQVFLWFCLRSERRWEKPKKNVKVAPCQLNIEVAETLLTHTHQCLMVFVLTFFSLPLVKHGEIVLRILFHLSSLTTVIPSSKGPEKRLFCRQKQEGTINTWTLGTIHDFSSVAHPAVGEGRVEFLHQHTFNHLRIWHH